MRENAIRLASAVKRVIFIYDSHNDAKTLLHYKLEDFFKKAGYSGNPEIPVNTEANKSVKWRGCTKTISCLCNREEHWESKYSTSQVRWCPSTDVQWCCIVFHALYGTGKTFLMRENAIRLASAVMRVIFIYDSHNDAKSLPHYKLEDFSKSQVTVEIRKFPLIQKSINR